MTNSPRFDHLVAMTDHYGTFEHAEHAIARREHGYCVDDVARVLLVASREPRPSEAVRSLAQGSLAFVTESMGPRGDIRNRRSTAPGRARARPRTVGDEPSGDWEQLPRAVSSPSPEPLITRSNAERCNEVGTCVQWPLRFSELRRS